MSSAVQDRIRTVVASAIRRGTLPGAGAAHPGHRPAQPAAPVTQEATPGQSDLLEGFAAAAALVGASVTPCSSMTEVLAALEAMLSPEPGASSPEPSSPRRFVAWEDDGVAPVVKWMIERGWERVAQDVPLTGEGRAARLHELASCSVGLTSAVAALADTGSIVLESGPGRSRLASLLPPVHIALVPADRICASLASWLSTRDTATLPSNLIVVTGPSRTADIEQTLTRGVHGPKALHIVVVPA
jgi:L-lactate dehydrogenase complex protein LldG